MAININSYSKTDNFLKSQINRNIDDNLIQLILSKIDKPIKSRTIIIVDNKVINDWENQNLIDNNYKSTKSLFISLDSLELFTCFFANYNHYQGRKENTNYIIITKYKQS